MKDVNEEFAPFVKELEEVEEKKKNTAASINVARHLMNEVEMIASKVYRKVDRGWLTIWVEVEEFDFAFSVQGNVDFDSGIVKFGVLFTMNIPTEARWKIEKKSFTDPLSAYQFAQKVVKQVSDCFTSGVFE